MHILALQLANLNFYQDFLYSLFSSEHNILESKGNWDSAPLISIELGMVPERFVLELHNTMHGKANDQMHVLAVYVVLQLYHVSFRYNFVFINWRFALLLQISCQ